MNKAYTEIQRKFYNLNLKYPMICLELNIRVIQNNNIVMYYDIERHVFLN